MFNNFSFTEMIVFAIYKLIALVSLARKKNNIALLRNFIGILNGFFTVLYADIFALVIKASRNFIYNRHGVFIVGIIGRDN